MGYYDRLNKVENVTGSIAIITCPLNRTYDKIRLILGGGAVPADIAAIRGLANDRLFFEDTGTLARLRETYKGVTLDASQVLLNFTEPKARNGASEQYAASIPANLLKSLVFEVEWTGGAPGGRTLAVDCSYRGKTTNPYIKKQLRTVANIAAAGEQSFFLPSGVQGGIIKRLWAHHNGQLTGLRLELDRRIAARYEPISRLRVEQAENGLVPQNASNVDVLDFVQDGNLMGALNTAEAQAAEIELAVTAGAAIPQLTTYLEYIDPISRL